MKKTHDEYMNELREHRFALQSLTIKMQNVQHQIDELADLLNDESTSARELLETVPAKQQKRITAQHFRFLAILNEYGDVHREHVGKLLGLKAGSVDQLACEIRKHHLADLRSRKGVYTLHALGDDVRENSNFKLV